MKNPIFNIHDVVLVLTLAVCLLLAVFQLLLSKQKTIASQLLAAFFVCVGVNALCVLLLWNDYIRVQVTFFKYALAYVLVIAVIAKSLFLYWYVAAITREQFVLPLNKRWMIVSLIMTAGIFFAAGINSDALRFVSPTQTAQTMLFMKSVWHFLKVFPVVYAFITLLVVQRYKEHLKNFYSDLSLQGPEGLMLLVLGFALSWSWSLFVHVLGQFFGVAVVDRFGIIDNYITFVLVNGLFLFSVLYAHELIETKSKPKDKESLIVVQPSQQVIDSIQCAMEVDQLYLKQNLNIETFAQHLNIHYREVSNVINKHFGTNFFEFVNAYRVTKAKSLLVDPAFADKTIMYILLESGFNSKSAFHRFFKRYTGMSAADYRKQQIAANSTPPTQPVKDVKNS